MNDNRIPNEFEALLNERDAMIEAALGAEHVLGAAKETAQIARLLEQTREPDTAEIVPLKKRAHHTGKRIAILAAAAVLAALASAALALVTVGSTSCPKNSPARKSSCPIPAFPRSPTSSSSSPLLRSSRRPSRSTSTSRLARSPVKPWMP